MRISKARLTTDYKEVTNNSKLVSKNWINNLKLAK